MHLNTQPPSPNDICRAFILVSLDELYMPVHKAKNIEYPYDI